MRLIIRIILFIFALSMFLSCQEDTNSGFRQCGRMILSDALPVQFWLSECDTFNEHEAGGVHHVCWCQPWNSSDPIVIQFQDDPGQTINMVIISSDEELLYEAAFSEVQSGVYQHSFIPENENLTGQIQILISNVGAYDVFLTESGFVDDGLTTPWLIAPYQMYGKTMTATLTTVVPSGTNIDIDVTIGSGSFYDFTISLLNSVGGVISTHGMGGLSVGTSILNVTPGTDVHAISFVARCSNLAQQCSLTSIIVVDRTTLINSTSFNTGWATVNQGGSSVDWVLGATEATSSVGASPNDLTDYLHNSITTFPAGALVSGNFTHNVPIGLSGVFTIDVLQVGITHQSIFISGTITGTGVDVNVPIPNFVPILGPNTNVTISFQRTSGSGTVSVKDIFLEISTYYLAATYTDFTQSGLPGYAWTNSSGSSVLTIPAPTFGLDYTYDGGSGAAGRTLKSGLSIPIEDYFLSFDYSQSSSTTTRFLFEFMNAADTVVKTLEFDATGSGSYSGDIELPEVIEKVSITATSINGTGVMEIENLSLTGINESDVLAKSDCLEIAESHDETIFIEYSNQTNFAGLIYENDSPDTTFGIRVPCRFFHEVEPEEDEAMELTSSVIITSAQVKTQRLLEVKHAPYYFHKKLRRVLKHQTITIFDKQWKKEEKYEVIEGKKTWPLKAATCLLTEKNSVVRNVL